MSNVKGVILLGGPADGRRILQDITVRTVRIAEVLRPMSAMVPLPGQIAPPLAERMHAYAIQAVPSQASHMTYYVGVVNLTDCPICMLMGGYRRQAHEEMPLPVLAHEDMVTLLGGPDDGMRVILPLDQVEHESEFQHVKVTYRITSLTCKNDMRYRVGTIDGDDPLMVLYMGYRREEVRR